MIAALYVEKGGVYYGLQDVDPWDEERDARLYAGPWPVVAHPPCARWSHFWFGSTSPFWKGGRLKKGDDGGCFAAALAAVRRWGGVLEHPQGSHAWEAFGLQRPLGRGAWTPADFERGWTCEVEQGRYGHRARKATWLYAYGVRPPSLDWRPAEASMPVERMWSKSGERGRTPIPFRDLLLSIARTARPAEAHP